MADDKQKKGFSGLNSMVSDVDVTSAHQTTLICNEKDAAFPAPTPTPPRLQPIYTVNVSICCKQNSAYSQQQANFLILSSSKEQKGAAEELNKPLPTSEPEANLFLSRFESSTRKPCLRGLLAWGDGARSLADLRKP
jgi:hypothetical protein